MYRRRSKTERLLSERGDAWAENSMSARGRINRGYKPPGVPLRVRRRSDFHKSPRPRLRRKLSTIRKIPKLAISLLPPGEGAARRRMRVFLERFTLGCGILLGGTGSNSTSVFNSNSRLPTSLCDECFDQRIKTLVGYDQCHPIHSMVNRTSSDSRSLLRTSTFSRRSKERTLQTSCSTIEMGWTRKRDRVD